MFGRTSRVRTKDQKRRRVRDPRQAMLLRQIAIGLSIFVLAGSLIAGIWYGTRIPALTITAVKITGGETIDHEEIRSRVLGSLSGSYLGLIPRRFAWFYPEEDVLKAVRSVSKVKDPAVNRISGTELAVTFEEYEPYALWCSHANEECYQVDDKGYAFARSPKLKGAAFMRYYTTGREPMAGETMIGPEDLLATNEFIELLSQTPFVIQAVEVDQVSDVFYSVSGGGEFRSSLKDEPAQVFENLQAVLAAPEFAALDPGNFQYIDLRFGSKVFVNDVEPGSITASTSVSSTTEQ